ncbi:hypothetical protein CWATWH0005_3314 [Crocosphaera watsonii WH 0005]|uniref:Uncharacterized protein n=1 Tax=Crocosphaera watsonii WH 0005 TaxID=423472 RepID=T2IQA4_CROWT|nr:hypothetical protein CWATWH0005_3314 [Crocosphaera watsonii WH 0005]
MRQRWGRWGNTARVIQLSVETGMGKRGKGGSRKHYLLLNYPHTPHTPYAIKVSSLSE